MSTETISSRYAGLDLWPTGHAVLAMSEGQLAAAAAVHARTEEIAAAADAASARLRLGPTYDWDSERLVFAVAGGMAALVSGIEGAEDDAAAGKDAILRASPTPNDVVIGVAASGRTPYTVAAVRAAATRGALTVGLANNAGTPLLEAAAHPIFLDTGAEVVAGSTRMKAGTAQKIALNLFSTAVMLRLGRVYNGVMVDMRVSNQKLRARAVDMIREISGVERTVAEQALDRAKGDIKLAALVALGAEAELGAEALRQAGDNLRTAIDSTAAARHPRIG